MERAGGSQEGEKDSEKSVAYERPKLVVIGNLKDLLAGSGTQLSDDELCNAANSETFTC